MAANKTRLQNAMEFMMTYGWAILILMVVLATLYSLGVFNPPKPNICALPANVGCLGVVLWGNGVVQVNLQQATQYTINVVGVGCNDQDVANVPLLATPQTIPIGGNATFSTQCYTTSKWIPYNGAVGASYTGYLFVNYTDLSTGFSHTVSGTLIQTVK